MQKQRKMNLRRIIAGLLTLILVGGGWYSEPNSVEAFYAKGDTEFKPIDINEFIIMPEPISEIHNGTNKAVFGYDDNGLRITKKYGEKQTVYKYDNNTLVAENGKHNLEFFYEDGPAGTPRCGSLSIDGAVYFLKYDEMNNVSSVYNNEGVLICTYVYKGSVVKTYDAVGRCRDEDEDFVGVINPFRYQGWYYDSELNHFYLGEGIFYNALTGEYVNNPYRVNKEKLEQYVRSFSSEPQIVRDILNDYSGYMSQTNYGSMTFQDNYISREQWQSGSRWYTSLSQVEVMARCIYGENNTASPKNGPNDRVAITAVIMNRVNSGMASSTYGAVVAYDEFYTINPGSYDAYVSDTRLARQSKNKTEEAWKQATLMACVLHNTTNKTELGYIATIPSFINTQKYFCSLDASYNENRFTHSGSTWSYRGNVVTNLALAGTTSLANASNENPDPYLNARDILSPYRSQGYNIFYNR